MRKLLPSLVLSLCLVGHFSHAVPLEDVAASAKSDLQDALERLARQREEIQRAKTPLTREANAWEIKARAKRKEFAERLRLRDNQESSLSELSKDVTELEGDLEAILGLLNDYNRSWFEGLTSPEREFHRRTVRNILLSEEAEALGKDGWSNVEPQVALVELSVKRLKETFGGTRFKGKAVTPDDDVEEEGNFLVVGPVAYFSSSKTNSSGIVESARRHTSEGGGKLDAKALKRSRASRVLPAPDQVANTIRDAINALPEDTPTLVFDPTLGKATVLASSDPSLLEELEKGGVWIFPILGFALLSTVIAGYKAFQILSVKLPEGQPALNGIYTNPFSGLRDAALNNQGKSAEILEETLYEQIIEAQARLEKLLPVVAVTAAAAPLLGLLGTVTGMIDVFQQLYHFSNPENSELSRGISEALVTTKFGLITAIPALIVHALLSRRVQGIVAKMESFSTRLVNLSSAPTTTDHTKPPGDEFSS